MELDEYQAKAEQTARPDLSHREAIANWALGLAGESGEVCDHIKKFLAHGHALDLDEIEKELGDVLWYVAMLAYQLDIPLDQIAAANIAKLQGRYGDKFSSEKSLNREEGSNDLP